MKCEAIIFDLDGTILDTLPDLHGSVNFALGEMGYDKRSIDEVRCFVGNGIGKLIERAVPSFATDEDTKKCLGIFMEHYNNNLANLTKPYDGIVEMLHSLKARGFRLAVLSNKRDDAVKALVDKFFPDTFQYVSGEKQNIPRKPHPQGVFNALEELSVSAENTVYVGDSEVDVETARNSGLKCFAVSWGFRDKSVLIDCKPEYIIDKPSLLAELL